MKDYNLFDTLHYAVELSVTLTIIQATLLTFIQDILLIQSSYISTYHFESSKRPFLIHNLEYSEHMTTDNMAPNYK